MIDVKAIMEEFQLGGIERIFICFFSYFIVGYLILFTIYEDGFINLNLSTQIFLAISISFPITTISSFLLKEDEDYELTKEVDELTEEVDELAEEVDELAEEDRVSIFYDRRSEFFGTSIYYSIMFSLFYVVKKSDIIHYNSKLDPFIGLAIILFFLAFTKLWKNP